MVPQTEEPLEAQLEKLLDDCRRRISLIQLEPPAPRREPPRAKFPEPPPPSAPPPRAAAAPEPARGRRARWYALALAALLAGAGYGRWRQQARARTHFSFPLAYSDAAGLAVKDGVLVSADPKRRLLYTYSTDAVQVLSVQKSPDPAPTGLTWGDGCLWTADPESGAIHQHEPSQFEVRRTFANPERSPSALYWDGRRLWASDARTETVYQYAVGASLAPAAQHTLPGIVPVGFHLSEDLLWVFDALTRKVYRYRIGGLLTVQDSYDLSPWLPAASRAKGFTADKDDLWLVTENPAEIHRFDLKSLTPRSEVPHAGP